MGLVSDKSKKGNVERTIWFWFFDDLLISNVNCLENVVFSKRKNYEMIFNWSIIMIHVNKRPVHPHAVYSFTTKIYIPRIA